MANIRRRKARKKAGITSTKYGHKRKKFNKTPVPQMEELKARWDKKKSAKQNMKALGLVYDVNATLPIRKLKEPENNEDDNIMMMTIADAKRLQHSSSSTMSNSPDPLVKKWMDGVKKKREDDERGTMLPTHHFSQREKKFLNDIIHRHGSNYVAMSRDKKNVYQLTPCQLERKCKAFLLTLASITAAEEDDS